MVDPSHGYDSHASDHLGTEIVIFDGNQVMPLYRVTFTKPGAPVAAVRQAAAVRGGREAANNAAALVAELQDSTARQQGTHAFVAQLATAAAAAARPAAR